jgi:hypothetical protein
VESSIVKISNIKFKSFYVKTQFIDMPVGVVPEKIEKVQVYRISQESGYDYKSPFKVLLYDSTQVRTIFQSGTSRREFDWGFSSDGQKLVIYTDCLHTDYDAEVWIYVKP